jgi:Uma2 family endonuclease
MLLQSIDEIVFDYETERNKPMPSLNHGSIQANLIMELAKFRKKFRISSELSFDLSDWPSVPDICIFPKMELDLKNDTIAMVEPPLCIVEIVSPSQSVAELAAKADKYFAHGVKSCWLVIPTFGNVYVYSDPYNYTIFRTNEMLNDEVLGIQFPLKEVFE